VADICTTPATTAAAAPPIAALVKEAKRLPAATDPMLDWMAAARDPNEVGTVSFQLDQKQ